VYIYIYTYNRVVYPHTGSQCFLSDALYRLHYFTWYQDGSHINHMDRETI